MTSQPVRSVAIVGGGPAGLMAAETIADGAKAAGLGVVVTVYDRMPSLGRKFLLAGRGGLNLTHSEPLAQFVTRFGASVAHLKPLTEAYTPDTVRHWAEGLGEPTFVGTSGRVFPKSFKTSPLLRAWLRRLDQNGVRVATRHQWAGWGAAGELVFTRADGSEHRVTADALVLALGGASWPKLGADGSWVPVMTGAGIDCTPLRPANCGVEIAWPGDVIERFAGTPLKRIALSLTERALAERGLAGGGLASATMRGEVVLTREGLEGGAVYALSAAIREALDGGKPVTVALDLRPDLDLTEMTERLAQPRDKQSLATHLRKALGLPPLALALLRTFGPKLPDDPEGIAARVKAVPLPVHALRPITRAISTAGGISWGEVDASLMLVKRPGTFVAGEMLDWEAPTGGYLLQGCFSTGAAAGTGALRWIESAPG
jgi:uncharacterized flavoprotein (TIGR03862 family)